MSDSDMAPAKAQRTPSSDKYFFFFFAPFAFLRRCSGHALQEIFRDVVAALPR
jgi:hypothetical protein